jgi:hypothetical protein
VLYHESGTTVILEERLASKPQEKKHSEDLGVLGVISKYIFFQCPKSGVDRLIVDISTSHTHTHTHRSARAMALLSMSDQLVAKAATYTTQDKHKWRIYIPSTGFEPAIPAIDRRYSYVLDRYGHRNRPNYAVCVSNVRRWSGFIWLRMGTSYELWWTR